MTKGTVLSVASLCESVSYGAERFLSPLFCVLLLLDGIGHRPLVFYEDY